MPKQDRLPVLYRSQDQALATLTDLNLRPPGGDITTRHRLVRSGGAPAGVCLRLAIGRGSQRVSLGWVGSSPVVCALDTLEWHRVLDGQGLPVWTLGLEAGEQQIRAVTAEGEAHWDNGTGRWAYLGTALTAGLRVFDASGGLIEAEGGTQLVRRHRGGTVVPLGERNGKTAIRSLVLHPGDPSSAESLSGGTWAAVGANRGAAHGAGTRGRGDVCPAWGGGDSGFRGRAAAY